jgi:hypothetical protein
MHVHHFCDSTRLCVPHEIDKPKDTTIKLGHFVQLNQFQLFEQFLRWYLKAPGGFVNAPDLARAGAARDILHAHSAGDELQHGLPL